MGVARFVGVVGGESAAEGEILAGRAAHFGKEGFARVVQLEGLLLLGDFGLPHFDVALLSALDAVAKRHRCLCREATSRAKGEESVE